MVYYRRYRSVRSTRRGYARRGRTGYSMYSLYRKRSNAAQARQIYGLNKRISRIQRLNKPEIKIAHGNNEYTLPFGSTERISQTSTLLPSSFTGSIDGKFVRLNSMTVTLSFRYENASLVQVDELSNTQRLPQPMYLRLLFVQTKATRQTAIDVGDVIDETNNLAATRGPLADGAARIAKILADKKFMINYNRQTVNKVIRFNYLRNYYKATSEPIAKGDVRIFIVAWKPGQLAEDATTNVTLNLNTKIAYTDA